jgi:hypothetical protein
VNNVDFFCIIRVKHQASENYTEQYILT